MFLQVRWPNQQCQSTEGGRLVIQIALNLTGLISPCYTLLGTGMFTTQHSGIMHLCLLHFYLHKKKQLPCSFLWWWRSGARCRRARRSGSHGRLTCCDRARTRRPQTPGTLPASVQDWLAPYPTHCIPHASMHQCRVTTLQTLWNSLTFPWQCAALMPMLSGTHSMPVVLVLM